MNGIEKITGKILEDAQAFAAEEMAKAEAKAAEIAAIYAERAEKEKNMLLERGRETARDAERRVSSVAALELRKQALAKKQELIAAAFATALQRLNELPEEEYLPLLIRYAVENSSSGQEELLFSAADQQTLGARVVAGANEKLAAAGRIAALTLSAETANIDRGLMLREGDVEVNCSFATIVSFLKEKLSLEVGEALFA